MTSPAGNTEPTAALDAYDSHIADDLWEAIAAVRDAHPRVPNDAETWDLVAAAAPIVARALAAAVTAERDKYLRVARELDQQAVGPADPRAKAARRIREVSR